MSKTYRNLQGPRKQEVFTPDWVYDLLDEWYPEAKEWYDPCPCPRPKGFDGLKVSWKKYNYINPPFNNIEPFIKKGQEAYEKGKTSIFFVPGRINQEWFLDYIWGKHEFLPVKREVAFKGYDKTLSGAMMFVVMDPNQKKLPCRYVLRPIDVLQEMEPNKKATRALAEKENVGAAIVHVKRRPNKASQK